MTTGQLLGRVVVVAGRLPLLADLAAALVDDGALVAFIAPDVTVDTAQASVRADPTDPAVWERAAPHVEQRLGPVDAVVVDGPSYPVVDAVFRTDLVRRGHGDIVVAGATDDVDELLSRLRRMQ